MPVTSALALTSAMVLSFVASGAAAQRMDLALSRLTVSSSLDNPDCLPERPGR